MPTPNGWNKGRYGQGWFRVTFNQRLRVYKIHLPRTGRKRKAWCVALETGHVLLFGYWSRKKAKAAMDYLVKVTDWNRQTEDLRQDKGLWKAIAQQGADDGVLFCGKDGKWVQGRSKEFDPPSPGVEERTGKKDNI